MIDDQICPKIVQRCGSFVAAGGCGYPGSSVFGKLDRNSANAAGACPDEDALSWLEVAEIEQATPGCGSGEPGRDRMLERDAIGNAHQISGGHGDLAGIAATAFRRDRRRRQDALSGFETVGGTDHDTCGLQPWRKGNAKHWSATVALEKIEAVDGS